MSRNKPVRASRVFSVMRRRDDLPEMTLPLAILMMVLNLVFTVVAAKLASADLIGAVAALPFLTIAVCTYSLIILLWRRAASLLVTPFSFAAMYLLGASLFVTVAISLSTLFTSYVFAVALISRDSKFKRLTALSASIAVCIVLTVIACAGFVSGTFEEFITYCMNSLSGVLSNLYNNTVTETYLHTLARSLIIMTPAYMIALSISLAWLTEFLVKNAFRILDCTDIFIGITHRITLPLAYAVIYIAVFTMAMFTIPAQNPKLYVMLDSIVISMMLPCAAVGVSMTLRKIRVRMYYASQKRMMTSILMLFAFFSLGAVTSAMLLSLIGAYFVIFHHLKILKKRKQNDKDSEWNGW